MLTLGRTSALVVTTDEGPVYDSYIFTAITEIQGVQYACAPGLVDFDLGVYYLAQLPSRFCQIHISLGTLEHSSQLNPGAWHEQMGHPVKRFEIDFILHN